MDHEHHKNISHYLIDVAIQEILDKGVQLNKILITARVADKGIIEAITDYNFEEVEKNHCLGLKF